MEKRNHFSDRFEKKTSDELRQIAGGHDFSDDAQLAAIWELERRDESDTEHLDLANRMATRQKIVREKKQAYRKYRTFFPRLLASIIDGLILFAISLAMAMVLPYNLYSYTETAWISELLDGVITYGYFVWMHGHFGQTLGKMAMNVKVVNYGDETPISYKQALIRDIVPIVAIILVAILNFASSFLPLNTSSISTLMYYLSSVSTIWIIAEIITMLFNAKSRALHDFIAKTVVINLK